jgi:hypothetical protein
VSEGRAFDHLWSETGLLLDLVATVVFLSAIVTGTMLIWRKLLWAGEASAGEPVCLACQIPARFLPADSFICPACQRDVRFMGIGRVRPRGFAAPFWRLVNYSVVLCVLGLISSVLLISELPRVDYISAQSNMQFEGEPYQALDLNVVGYHTGDSLLEGELSADLYLHDGQMVSLIIQSPSKRYQSIDSAGHESKWSQELLNQEAVLRWMVSGGIDVSDPGIRREGQWMLRKLEGGLRAVTAEANLDSQSSALQPRFSSSGTSSTGNSGPPPGVTPLCVVAWSLIWLAGVWLILRRGTRKPRGEPA